MEEYLNSKINVVIAGYPKSGTHWVSWLVAEMLGAHKVMHLPIELGESIGPGTISEKSEPLANCFKTHLTCDQIEDCFDKNQTVKILHVVRDPRDIVVSGAYYFSFKKSWIERIVNNKLFRSMQSNGNFKSFIEPSTSSYKKTRMLNAVVNGDPNVSEWLGVSWKEYTNSFINSDVLQVRYEDLMQTPQETCKIICDFLSINVSDDQIRNAITNQSFEQKTQRNWGGYNIIRNAQVGSWKGELNKPSLDKIQLSMKNEMHQLGYTF
ncbi:MAG: sulfotransferase domain-containing protein [Flavobacteriales bacterium]